jgi:hypothetical protein
MGKFSKGLQTEANFGIAEKLVKTIKIISEKGDVLKVKNPFGTSSFEMNTNYIIDGEIIIIETFRDQKVILK